MNEPLFNLIHAGCFYAMHYSPILINFRMYFTRRVESSVDSDQLASQKPADLDLPCFQNRVNLGLAWQGLNISSIEQQENLFLHLKI